MTGLDNLRLRYCRFLVGLVWLHVPLIALVATAREVPLAGPVLMALLLAGALQLSWWRDKIGPATRYVSAVAVTALPALLVYLLRGDPWQMDMHMYFFAMLALLIGWCDWRPVIVAAATIIIHHLLFNLLLPFAVFPLGTDLNRVLLHAGIVALQTTVLVWISKTLVETFERVDAMRTELMLKNDALERSTTLVNDLSRIKAMQDEIVAKNVALEQRTQEAKAASISKSLFLANMSHEIRTPMNAILGFSHLALRTNLTPRQADYVSKIRNSCTILLNLINDILDFSKIEAGKLSLEQSNFNPRDVVDTAASLFTDKAAAKQVALRIRIAPDVPETLRGDALRLNQILVNLIGNAIKFTQHGSVDIAVRNLADEGSDITLQIEVRDTGIGMTEEQRSTLFQSFSQADSSTTRKFGGTGLGLAITRQLVELMGGEISVESRPGIGSTFTLQVKLQIAAAPPSRSAQLAPEQIHGLRVLIVDDNSASREILHNIFLDWSMQAELATSGQEALAALQAAQAEGRPYDLMLMDWKMPGMDGFETVARMRRLVELEKQPAVLIVSAYSNQTILDEMQQAAISAFLVKPIAPALLLKTINGLLAPETTADDGSATAEPVPMVAPALRGSRILLVEDNEINCELAGELLRDCGLVVDVAVNGRLALERIQQSGDRYDAILMDVQMPEMDGIEATLRIRKLWSAQRLPIIAMTAHAYEQERQNCLNAGMNDHIAKPVDPAILMRTLDRWITPRTHEAPGGPPRAQPASGGELPAALPPFNLAAALPRVNGKKTLLHKLIVDFAGKFEDAAQTMKDDVALGDTDKARRLAHTIKGVAGSLEARDLAEASRQLEDALAAGKLAELDRLVARFDAELQPALAAAKSLRTAPPPGPATATPEAAPAEISPDAERLIAELRTQLQRRNLGARRTFAALAAALGSEPQGARLYALNEALSQLDFSKAQAELDKTFTDPPRSAVSPS